MTPVSGLLLPGGMENGHCASCHTVSRVWARCMVVARVHAGARFLSYGRQELAGSHAVSVVSSCRCLAYGDAVVSSRGTDGVTSISAQLISTAP